MRFARRLLPWAAVASALLIGGADAGLAATPGCAAPAASARLLEAATPVDAPAVAGELVVRYRSDAGAARVSRTLAAAGASQRRVSGRLAVVRVPGRTGLRVAAASLRRDPDVLWAEPNYVYRAERTPNDPLFDQQWALDNTGGATPGGTGTAGADIGARAAWDITTGSSSVLVAVVDSGIDLSHPDLAPNVATNPGEAGNGRESNGIDDDGNGYVDDWQGWDFAGRDNTPQDGFGHGSHVAGTIGARGDDGRGIAGIAWQVGLLPLRALNDDGTGSSLDIAAAFTYAAARDARVVNVSLGGPGFSNAMLDAICGAPNTLFVVAAGNSSKDDDATPFYPCAYDVPNVVCVAATDATDHLASFSNFGARSVDLAAPGVGILSTVPGGGVAYYSGTSMATPHVSGAAALVLSLHPEYSPAQVKAAILAGVDPLPTLAGRTVSGGRLDLVGALRATGVTAQPAATTGAAGPIGAVAATVAGTVEGGGAPASFHFEYGLDTTYGAATPEANVAPGAPPAVSAALTDLAPATTYHYRLVATTSAGGLVGADATFTTAGAAAAASTGPGTQAGSAAARLTGTITPGTSPVFFRFDWGATTAYGQRTASRRLGASDDPIDVAATITGLRAGRTYHFRLVVTGPDGTVRGADHTVSISSTALRVRRARAVGSSLHVTVQVPGPGRVTAIATSRVGLGRVRLGQVTRAARHAGVTTMTVRLSSRARELRALDASPITVTVTFVPAGHRGSVARSVRLP